MILEALRLALAAALLVALPGILLSYALFPRKGEIRPSERIYLSLAGGMLILMAVALVLGFLPHGSRGALQSLAVSGMPNVELTMLAVDLGLAWAAIRRGALPALAARLPTSWRARATSPLQGPGR